MTTPDDGILIVGADGWLGRALTQYYDQLGVPVRRTSRRPGPGDGRAQFLDLDQDLERWHPPEPVGVAFLCAAVTSLKRCKEYPEGSARVNVQQTVRVARSLLAAGAFVVFTSTNLVFDGSMPAPRESDPPSPRTEYGRQKSEAERGLLDLGSDRVAIVRPTKIVGSGIPLFEGWIRSLREGEAIHPFQDLPLAPISQRHAVTALARIAEARRPGILHVSAAADLSYAEAARHLAARLHVDLALVRPILSGSSEAAPEWIPKHSTLDAGCLHREFGIAPPAVSEGLEALIP